MKKYDYFVDETKVKRNEFFNQLRNYSQTARLVDTINGWCGISIMEFDEKKYNRHVRDINNGIIVMIVNEKFTKTFRRKERR